MSEEFTHVDEEGDARMVDVGDKAESRAARSHADHSTHRVDAGGHRADEIGKGDVLATARIGAIQAVKHTWETIPMCHQIPITNVDTEFEVGDESVTLSARSARPGRRAVRWRR